MQPKTPASRPDYLELPVIVTSGKVNPETRELVDQRRATGSILVPADGLVLMPNADDRDTCSVWYNGTHVIQAPYREVRKLIDESGREVLTL